MTQEDVMIQKLLRTNQDFKAETKALLYEYRKSNWGNTRERRQFRKNQHAFREKWGWDFSIIAFHYHMLRTALE